MPSISHEIYQKRSLLVRLFDRGFSPITTSYLPRTKRNKINLYRLTHAKSKSQDITQKDSLRIRCWNPHRFRRAKTWQNRSSLWQHTSMPSCLSKSTKKRIHAITLISIIILKDSLRLWLWHLPLSPVAMTSRSHSSPQQRASMPSCHSETNEVWSYGRDLPKLSGKSLTIIA